MYFLYRALLAAGYSFISTLAEKSIKTKVTVIFRDALCKATLFQMDTHAYGTLAFIVIL